MAAARRRREDESRRARERERERERESSQSSYGYGSSKSRGSSGKPYIDCVMREIVYEGNTELETFAHRLDDCCRELKAQKGKEYVVEAEKCMDLVVELDAKRAEIANELQLSGVTLEVDRDTNDIMVCGTGGFSYENSNGDRISMLTRHNTQTVKVCYTRYTTFNGVHLDRKAVTDPNDTRYKDRYEELKEENVQVREEKERLLKEIEKKERRLKYSLFGKEDKKSNIAELKSRVAKCDEKIAAEEEAKRRYETFAKLTPEQKEKIAKYMEMSDSMDRTISMISRYGHKFQEEATIRRFEYDKEIIEQGLTYMAEKYGMEEKDIDEIFKKLDLIAIKRNRGEYDFSTTSYYGKYSEYSDSYRKIKGVMQGFIKHVYEKDEEFIERNIEETVIE